MIIFLNDNYQWSEYDNNLENGIIIDKSIIIDGQGHKIDANHKMRIFQVTNDTIVTFKNINFLNGFTVKHGSGGAIWNNGAKNITIINCIFTGNTAEYGGAVKGGTTIVNCTFINNKAKYDGGAIMDGTVINSTFTNNIAYDGGAIVECEVIDNCIFTNNTAKYRGGAIFTNKNIIVKNTTFKNNKAEGGRVLQCCGGAIYCGGNVEVDICTFVGNHADEYGGAIYADTITWINNSSYFISNYVNDNQGGAIYTNKFETEQINSKLM